MNITEIEIFGYTEGIGILAACAFVVCICACVLIRR